MAAHELSSPMTRRAFLAGTVAATCAAGPVLGKEPITVLASSALVSALDPLATAFRSNYDIPVRVVYGPSAILEGMLKRGAAADLFIPSGMERTSRAEADGRVVRQDGAALATSRLVLVTPRTGIISELAVGDGLQIADRIGSSGRLAICDPDVIGSGRYGKLALIALGQWSDLAAHLEITRSTQATLALVAGGEAALGIVLDTDVARSPGVKIVGVLPDGSHPPIVYRASLTSSGSAAASEFLTFLRSSDARRVFTREGFGLVS